MAVNGRGGQGGRRRSDAKRGAILRGAKSVFLRHGFGDASMDAVAGQARVSKMTLYRHFGSKEDLFAGVIADMCGKLIDVDVQRVFEDEPKKALLAYAQTMVETVFAREALELHRIVIAESRRFPQLGRMFYAAGPQTCVDVLTDYFTRHRNDPRLRIVTPRRSAEEFLELLRGYAHLRILLGLDRKPTAADIRARVDAAVRHVSR